MNFREIRIANAGKVERARRLAALVRAAQDAKDAK